MDENRMDRLEEMLSTLITMAGNIRSDMQEMRGDIQSLQKGQQEMRGEMNEKFAEVKNILIDMRADQDHIWEKAAKNERELAKFKAHLHSIL